LTHCGIPTWAAVRHKASRIPGAGIDGKVRCALAADAGEFKDANVIQKFGDLPDALSAL
jgi:hypothetical protein